MSKDNVGFLKEMADLCVDPRRSQIHQSIPEFVDGRFDSEGPIYVDRYATVYYDELAKRMLDWIERGVLSADELDDICDGIYKDYMQGFLGFIFDW